MIDAIELSMQSLDKGEEGLSLKECSNFSNCLAGMEMGIDLSRKKLTEFKSDLGG